MDEVLVLVGLAAGGWIAWKIAQQKAAEDAQVGPKIRCRFCNEVGHVTMRRVPRKKGVSGGKATGALFTAGGSMLFTGLSRKQEVRHMTCGNCRMEWDVE